MQCVTLPSCLGRLNCQNSFKIGSGQTTPTRSQEQSSEGACLARISSKGLTRAGPC